MLKCFLGQLDSLFFARFWSPPTPEKSFWPWNNFCCQLAYSSVCCTYLMFLLCLFYVACCRDQIYTKSTGQEHLTQKLFQTNTVIEMVVNYLWFLGLAAVNGTEVAAFTEDMDCWLHRGRKTELACSAVLVVALWVAATVKGWWAGVTRPSPYCSQSLVFLS